MVPLGCGHGLMVTKQRCQGGSVGIALGAGCIGQRACRLQPRPHRFDKGGVSQHDVPVEACHGDGCATPSAANRRSYWCASARSRPHCRTQSGQSNAGHSPSSGGRAGMVQPYARAVWTMPARTGCRTTERHTVNSSLSRSIRWHVDVS